MIKGTKDELDKLVLTHKCPEHGPLLVVSWHGEENSYVLHCGHGHYPEEITMVPTRTEEYKRGELEAVDKNFSLLPQVDLETGELLSPDLLHGLIAYAKRYGLDPYRGHVVLMHGKPYIGLDGYIYHAKQENIPFSLTGRPATPDDLKYLGYSEGDLGWDSKVERLDTGEVYEGWGFVTKAEIGEMSKKNPAVHRYPVIANKPGNMVIKRADWQALRRAFPIGKSEEVRGEQ